MLAIDKVSGGRACGHKNREHPESNNVYITLLVQLYRFLARRTNAKFPSIVLKRLYMSRVNRPPMGLARLARYMKSKEDKIAVVVAKITDDERMAVVPALKVCALGFTEAARARIVKAGGECITLDQLALRAPTGSNTVLLQARRKARVAYKYFGVPGSSNSTTRHIYILIVRSTGRKFEMARGRRASRGFKV
ncbi:hypothetical protein WA158_004625 [Blastocystis sp. Blastoise]